MQATDTCRQPLHRAAIRVRTLAAIILALTLLWYVSFAFALRDGGKSFGELSDFWVVIYLGAPLIYLALAPIMARVHCREPQHPAIFWSALCFGVSPWLLFLLIICAS